MKLINLVDCYIYKRVETKIDGETSVNWIYDNVYKLNKQQDINELDRTIAGEVDYEIVKLRTDKTLDISKSDGVSFTMGDIPEYIVTGSPKNGRCTTYILKTYHGE